MAELEEVGWKKAAQKKKGDITELDIKVWVYLTINPYYIGVKYSLLIGGGVGLVEP